MTELIEYFEEPSAGLLVAFFFGAVSDESIGCFGDGDCFVGVHGMCAPGGAWGTAEFGDPGGMCVGDYFIAVRCAGESSEVSECTG
jgi:hypothetical protein